MGPELTAVAQQCLDAAQKDTMPFPAIVGKLIEAGFKSYAIDFRRQKAIYYCPNGDSVALPMAHDRCDVAAHFDGAALKSAILDAQKLAPGYSYAGFCERAQAAGCAGYLVSFMGRRAVYFGRTGETHVEMFPQ